MLQLSRVLASLLVLGALGCAGDPPPGGGRRGASPDDAPFEPGADAGAGDPTARFGGMNLCDQTPPPGASVPPRPKQYSGGACPTLQPGENTLQSYGSERKFVLLMPDDVRPGERLPLGFFWHWLGGSAQAFVERGELASAVNEKRFIAVVPSAKADLVFKWPMSILDPEVRVEEELTFFDDMLACVTEQFAVNTSCVTSAGVSAGALWTGQLAGERGEYLSSIVVLSGGTGGTFIKQWKPPARKMPALVLWGGASDFCVVVNFEETSKDLEMNLARDGHFLVECQHNCGHTVPPVEASDGGTKFGSMWDFALNHPYWLAAGESPFSQALPASFPSWCGVGMGSAQLRTEMCPDGPGC